MSFERAELIACCRANGRVARVVVAEVKGSAPREVGASMLIWEDGQSGTIGGGALEFEASNRARADLQGGRDTQTRHALGPDMGQCCGGAVHLWTEFYDLERANAVPLSAFARGKGPMPASVERTLEQWRAGVNGGTPRLIDGWMLEPVAHVGRPLWIWGAGHVGRALVNVLGPMPDFGITWIDTCDEKFPENVPVGVERVIARAPETLLPYAPLDAGHLVLTHSHQIDLALCHGLLERGFAFAGLIGSQTKWARFRKRLRELGHQNMQIDQIECPIGTPSHGKHPQAIAIGVADALLRHPHAAQMKLENIA